MRLEMATFPVKDVRYSNKTTYNSEVLEINKDELLSLILEDDRIHRADLDLAFPGEQTRIVNIRDVVEPRIKVKGPGCVFPGIMGPVETVGHGKTHRLANVAVVTTAEYEPAILSGTAAQNAGIVDMWGPIARMSPFGSTINIVPVLKLVSGVSELEAHSAIQFAEYKLANRLAETVSDLTNGDVEVFELFKADTSQPRVVYISSFLTWWVTPHSAVAYYGLSIREAMPFFIHPNELLDGAVTTDTRHGCGDYITTWHWMNHPVVYRLMREHGKKINFLGVIMQRTRFEAELGKKVTAACASQMAKILDADGAIITRTTGSGANLEDVMLTVQACERKGIKTVLLGPEWGSIDGKELPMVFYVPEATAMVSTGSHESEVRLPTPDKVIGVGESGLIAPQQGDKPFSPWREIVWEDTRNITGGPDWLGTMNLTAREY
jgi:glycine reductase